MCIRVDTKIMWLSLNIYFASVTATIIGTAFVTTFGTATDSSPAAVFNTATAIDDVVVFVTLNIFC